MGPGATFVRLRVLVEEEERQRVFIGNLLPGEGGGGGLPYGTDGDARRKF